MFSDKGFDWMSMRPHEMALRKEVIMGDEGSEGISI